MGIAEELPKYVYMAVSKDKYELPIAIGDTAKELASQLGTTESSIYSSISHGRKTFLKVNLGEVA